MDSTDPNPVPKLHSLDLATDECVSLAWIEFFAQCRRLAALSRQRRAAKEQEQSEDTEASANESEAS